MAIDLFQIFLQIHVSEFGLEAQMLATLVRYFKFARDFGVVNLSHEADERAVLFIRLENRVLIISVV